jgi:hypothetical protein
VCSCMCAYVCMCVCMCVDMARFVGGLVWAWDGRRVRSLLCTTDRSRAWLSLTEVCEPGDVVVRGVLFAVCCVLVDSFFVSSFLFSLLLSFVIPSAPTFSPHCFLSLLNE